MEYSTTLLIVLVGSLVVMAVAAGVVSGVLTPAEADITQVMLSYIGGL